MILHDLHIYDINIPKLKDGSIKVSDIQQAIIKYFGSSKYAIEEYIDPDSFYSKVTLIPYTNPELKPNIQKVWVQSKQQFLDIDINHLDDDELYIFNDNCYHGSKIITTDEYNSLTHTIKISK